MSSNLSKHFSSVFEDIYRDLSSINRERDSVCVVAVSKQQPSDRIIAALDYGHQVFGENRVQEAHATWTPLLEQYKGIKLHLIGPLQTNKVKQAIQLFDVIETLDREKLARALKLALEEGGKTQEFFIQVNVGEEEQKSGVLPLETPDFISFCRDELRLPVTGLMCIPPQGESPAPYFALLKNLAEDHQLSHVSMGMSNDYPLAMALGATHIRIGTAFFGSRNPNI